MATRVVATILAVTVLFSALPVAQARPDFTGTWTLNRKVSAIDDGGKNEGRGGGLPTAIEMTITQSATEMAVSSVARDN